MQLTPFISYQEIIEHDSGKMFALLMAVSLTFNEIELGSLFLVVDVIWKLSDLGSHLSIMDLNISFDVEEKQEIFKLFAQIFLDELLPFNYHGCNIVI